MDLYTIVTGGSLLALETTGVRIYAAGGSRGRLVNLAVSADAVPSTFTPLTVTVGVAAISPTSSTLLTPEPLDPDAPDCPYTVSVQNSTITETLDSFTMQNGIVAHQYPHGQELLLSNGQRYLIGVANNDSIYAVNYLLTATILV